MLPLCVVKSNEILRQLFWLERLRNGGSANRTNSEPLLLDFNQTLLTESVTAVEVARNPIGGVEVLVTRWTIHFIFS